VGVEVEGLHWTELKGWGAGFLVTDSVGTRNVLAMPMGGWFDRAAGGTDTGVNGKWGSHQQKSPALRSTVEQRELREHLNELSDYSQSAPRSIK
jgi:hypothetical protein